MIINRSQQTTESLSKHWADKNEIWGEGKMRRLDGACLKQKNQGLPLPSASFSVMEFGRVWEGRQLTGTRTHTS